MSQPSRDRTESAVSIELRHVTHVHSIIDEIWGSTLSAEDREARLDLLLPFLAYCQEQLDFGEHIIEELLSAIRLVRKSPRKRKSEIQSRCGEVIDANVNTAEEASLLDAEVLDYAIRTMFLTACARLSPVSMGHSVIFSPRWMDSESVEDYLARVYPISQAPQQDLIGLRLEKLCADYLQSYASLQIKWTDYLSDHLILLRGESWNHIYLFRHPSFLKVSLDVLKADDEDLTQTADKALKM
jgi:hypothetical protein